MNLLEHIMYLDYLNFRMVSLVCKELFSCFKGTVLIF